MDVYDMMNDIEKQRAELEAIQEKFLEQNQETFKELVKKFFELAPEVKLVGWSQYTPYFNDGETCEFGVNEVYFVLEDVDLDEVSSAYELEEYKHVPIPYRPASYEDTLKEYKAYAEGKSGWAVERAEAIQEISKECFDVCVQLDNLISKNEDLMLATFGDHAEIYMTREEIIVEESHHD